MLIENLRCLIVACLLVPILPVSAQIPELNENSLIEIWNSLRPDHNRGYYLPSDFAARPPSVVALEFVEQGQSDLHRKSFELTFPTSPLPRPKNGWLVLEENPHSCWVSRKEITALSLDPKNPRLIIGDYSNGNLPLTNPALTTAGYALRIIELTPSQAKWIIDFVWSLHQIKSVQIPPPPHTSYGSSSADSRGYLYLAGDSSYLGENTIWYTSPIQETWVGEYNKTTCLNFVAHFFRRGIPVLLKDRWQPSSLRFSSRTTPSYRSQNREQLTQAIALLLQENQSDPLPAQLLAFLIEAIGDCGMDSFEESLTQLQQSLPPLTKLEEYLSQNSFYNAPLENYHLFRQRNLTTLDLRENLDHSLAQIEALSSDVKLLPIARLDYPRGSWARKRLQFSRTKIARDFHLRQFYDAPSHGAKSSAMSKLTQYSPELTRSLISDLSDRRWKEFAPDFAHIITTPDKRLEQTLRAIALDTSIHERTRCDVIEGLGKLTPVDQLELVSFLVDFAQSFQNSPNSFDKNDLKISTIDALLSLGAISEGWAITKHSLQHKGTWSDHQLPDLALQYLATDPSLKNDIESTLVAAVTQFPFQLDHTALLTLPLDLPNLAAAITRQADHSLETRLAAKFHAQQTPLDRFTVLSSWAIQNHWQYDDHPTLFPLLESLARKSPPEQALVFLNWSQSKTDHDGFETILHLKSILN